MKQNKFDLVMSYIDANIQLNTEEIKKDICNLIGFSSAAFGNCFSILTNDTLFHYISERRMYFAGKELQEKLDKPICEIALEYGYSDQSAFTRAMKAFYKCTPKDIRKGKSIIPNNRYEFNKFNNECKDTRMQRILRSLDNNENISSYNMELLNGLENASKEYGFDFDTCCQIADLAEKLDISPLKMIDSCFNLVLEEKVFDPEPSLREQIAIELEISSEEELQNICNYFDCKYYDLDSFMVRAFREQTLK